MIANAKRVSPLQTPEPPVEASLSDWAAFTDHGVFTQVRRLSIGSAVVLVPAKALLSIWLMLTYDVVPRAKNGAFPSCCSFLNCSCTCNVNDMSSFRLQEFVETSYTKLTLNFRGPRGGRMQWHGVLFLKSAPYPAFGCFLNYFMPSHKHSWGSCSRYTNL